MHKLHNLEAGSVDGGSSTYTSHDQRVQVSFSKQEANQIARDPQGYVDDQRTHVQQQVVGEKITAAAQSLTTGAMAGATGAQRMLMLTDVEGVLAKDGKLIPELTINEANKLQKEGVISGGMIPKVETCIEAVKKGAEAAVILDGRVPHAVLLELFTSQGHGTIIRDD